tara:strand:+ start:129 stop:359 length:231 start_codon:yes stop_codon:yes gene_type:complete
MIKVSIKNFLHNFAKYKDKVKAGERLVILEHNKPVLDVIPHRDKVSHPGWKRDHYRLKNSSKNLGSDLVNKLREGR